MQALFVCSNISCVFTKTEAKCGGLRQIEHDCLAYCVPSTIRHHVGALARFLDWVAAHGAIPVNPLRLLLKGIPHTPTMTPAW
jgi:hypothetical protein